MSGSAGRVFGQASQRAGSYAGDLGHTFVRTVSPDPNQAVREGGRAASRSALALGGGVATGGVAVGGGYGLNSYFQRMETQELAEDRQNQQRFVEDVLNDPNINEEQQQTILEEALERGLLGNVRDQIPGSDDAFYENTYFQMIAAIIVIWYIGRRFT